MSSLSRRLGTAIWFGAVAATTACILGAGYSYGQEIKILKWDTQAPEKEFRFFADSPTDPYMVRLRTEFGLDKMTAGAKDDLERVKIITSWVHSQWEHKGDCTPPKNDPLAILNAAKSGARFSCREYALVTMDCLNSIGIKSRIVEIMPKDIEIRTRGSYHIVTEAFLPDRHKWVMADAQWNAVPTYKGKPLNIVETRRAIAEGRYKGLSFGAIPDSIKAIYPLQLADYIYFLRVGFINRVSITKLPTSVMGRRGVLLAPLDSEIPKSFLDATKGRVEITHNPSAFYGPIF